MKKLLILSIAFPPDGEVGALRPGSFAKYLPLYGWQPHTITLDPRHIERIDPYFQENLTKFGNIYPTRCLPHPFELYKIFKSLFHHRTLREVGRHESTDKPQALGRTILRKLLGTFICIPDKYWGWIPFAFPKALEIIRHENISMIYSTGPPWTSHVLGLLLKSVTRSFWLADFRDPWSRSRQNIPDSISFISKKIDRLLELLVLTKADRVLCVTDEMADDLITFYGRRLQNKLSIITNGFDREEFDRIPKIEPQTSKFILTHSGSFYGARSPLPFLRAISELASEDKLDSNHLLLRFIGPLENMDKSLFYKTVNQMGLSHIVELTGTLPRLKALTHITDSSLLLLSQPDTPLQIPVKFYEYLATGNPILAVASDGATKNAILKTGSGYVVSPGNIDQLKHTIMFLYRRWQQKNSIQPNYRISNNFDRKSLTRQLVDILENALPKVK